MTRRERMRAYASGGATSLNGLRSAGLMTLAVCAALEAVPYAYRWWQRVGGFR
jgi:hypothetical protein